MRETAPALAHQALAFFSRLYAVEHDAQALSPEARCALRQQQSVLILNDMHEWLSEHLRGLRPKSAVGSYADPTQTDEFVQTNNGSRPAGETYKKTLPGRSRLRVH